MISLSILTGILAAIVGILILSYRKFIEPYIGTEKRQKYFAEYLKEVGKLHNEKLGNLKQELFKSLLNNNPRKSSKLRILEIGAGSGTNLEFYPPNCQIVVVEPNPYAKKNFEEQLKKYPGIQLEKFIIGKSDDMRDLNDESFDAAISTLVGCNVDNAAKTYQEIKRLLVPGGKYFYVDHILDKSGTWLNWTQRILDYFNIWMFFFDGCHISRPLDKEIKKVGFSNVDQKQFYINTSGALAWHFIRHHVSGIATK